MFTEIIASTSRVYLVFVKQKLHVVTLAQGQFLQGTRGKTIYNPVNTHLENSFTLTLNSNNISPNGIVSEKMYFFS